MTETTATLARPMHRLHWWRELIYVLAFYSVYSLIRNQFGSAAVSQGEAFDHAKDVIHLERIFGVFHEETIQHWFLSWRAFIQFWNLFYGTFHFVVTAFCIIWLFRRFPERYVRWRTTLAVTTALALIGFAFFPLMPPRLLPHSYGFVDTLQKVGGLWSFDSGAMSKVSNQYAAMPSLHFAWSSWCALVLVPTLRRPGLKVELLNAPHDPKGEVLEPFVRAGAGYVDFAMLENVGAVARLRDRLGIDRILFGSHFPLFYLESALGKVREAGLSDAEAKAILVTNARALLPAPPSGH